MKRIYWIRHAQPAYPGGVRICLGSKIDVPLSEEGEKQAEIVGSVLANVPFEAVYVSPMLRARQTAARVASGRCPVVHLEELTELDGGDWDGMAFEEIYARYPAYFGQNGLPVPPPGGESDENGCVRIQRALKEIALRTQGCAAVVSHAGISRVLLCDLLGMPLRKKKQIHQPYAGITVLEGSEEGWIVRELGVSPEEFESARKE